MIIFDIVYKSKNNTIKDELKCGELKITDENELIIRLDNTLPTLNNGYNWVQFLKLCEHCCSDVDNERTEYTVTASELYDEDPDEEEDDDDMDEIEDYDTEEDDDDMDEIEDYDTEEVFDVDEDILILINPQIFSSARFKLLQRE